MIQCWSRNDEQEEREHNEGEGQAEELGPRLEESDEGSGCGRLQSGCELAEWKVEEKQTKVQSRCSEDAESVGQKTDIRLMADHLDLFQLIYRDWNEKADCLTHEAREKGASCNSFTMMEGSKLEAVKASFDGGVSSQEDRKVKHKVGSAYVIQASERKWRTTVKVAKVLPGDATITQAETTAAAARAICCLFQAGCTSFDLDGNLIEEWDKKSKKK